MWYFRPEVNINFWGDSHMGRKPTKKQREFAHAVVEGKTYAEAYRGVYDTKTDNNRTVWREAHAVAKNPHVAPMIEAGVAKNQREILRSLGKRREWIVGKLLHEAEYGDNPSTRVRSLELLGKASGLFTPQEERVDSTTEGELLDALRERLASVLPEPLDVTPLQSRGDDDEEGDPL